MAKKNKSLGLNKIIILCAIVFILGIGGTLWFYALYSVAWVDYLPIEVHIPNTTTKVGFAADPNFNFGQVPPTGIAKKEIHVWNENKYPVRVEFRVTGEVASWVYVEDNNFILQPDENKKMNVFLKVPANIPLAKGVEDVYTGEARIRQLRI